MKKNGFIRAVGYVDDGIIEKYFEEEKKLSEDADKKRRTLWVVLAASLAVIMIVLPVAAISARAITDNRVSQRDEFEPLYIDTNFSREILTGTPSAYLAGTSASSDSAGDPPYAGFATDGIVLKVRAQSSLPDVYCKLNVSSEYPPASYRIILFKTLEVIRGINVPDVFFYLMPEHCFVDLTVYDSLFISMSQVGTDGFVMKNSTLNVMESLDLPVFEDTQGNPVLGDIIAFSGGVFDESLWQNESWRYGYQFLKYELDNNDPYLVVYRGCDEKYTANKIREDEWFYEPEVISLNLKTEKATEALEYVKPFVNGVFSQQITYVPGVGNNAVLYRRYINGCETEETVMIDLVTEEVYYSEERYTEEDLSYIEDIAKHIQNSALEYAEIPPLPSRFDAEGKVRSALNLYGWYAKVDGEIYGVIKTVWIYYDNDYQVRYYDDSYTVYNARRALRKIVSRDELIELVGDRNVYTGDYSPESVPWC